MKKIILITIAVCVVVAHSSVRSQRIADTCGVRREIANSISNRIIHGQDFERGTFPWIVALMYTGGIQARFFCGASLISKTFVISGEYLSRLMK